MIDTASGSSTASRSPAEPNLTDRQSRPQVGSVLRRARMHHRLSLREVERRIGRSNAYLSQVERGLIKQPNLIVLLELAELYGLNFETLASWARWVPAAPDPMLSDPKEEWEALESEVESPLPYVTNVELSEEYYPRVNQKLIARMERLARAVALQFTIGDHPDPERNMIMLSSSISEFIHMKEFGINDYRKSVRILRQQKDNWERRSKFEILNSPWPTRVVTRAANDDQWPFRVDQVIVERRGGIFYVVDVEGYAFALNGAARSHYQYPDVHAAGVAILGKSVGPFIDMARELK